VTAPHDHESVAAASKPLVAQGLQDGAGRDVEIELRVERRRGDGDGVVEVPRPVGEAVSGTTAFLVQTLMHSPQSMQRSSSIMACPRRTRMACVGHTRRHAMQP